MLDVQLLLDVVHLLVNLLQLRYVQGLRTLFLFVYYLFSHLLDLLLVQPPSQSTSTHTYIFI